MNEDLLESVNKRLGLLIKVNMLDEFEGKTRAEQVKMLEKLDFRDEDIAEVLGISENYLTTVRSRMSD